MNINIKQIKQLVFKFLAVISLLFFATCKEDSVVTPCVSKFYYDGSPFRKGDDKIIAPSYESGEDIAGEFSSTPGLVILDKEKGTLDLAASVPGVYTVRKAMIGNSGCGNRIALGVIAILPPPSIFSSADQLAGWGWTGSGYLDKDDKQEGEASIKTSVPAGLVLMQHKLTEAIDTKVSRDLGQLHFWFYISDPTRLEGAAEIGQFELTSSGENDKQEYTWPVIPNNYNFKAGWNQIVLKFNEAVITGGAPDLAAINFFRLYMFPKDGPEPLIIGFDDMKILAETP
jgi:hypothetical protein